MEVEVNNLDSFSLGITSVKAHETESDTYWRVVSLGLLLVTLNFAWKVKA